MRRLGSPLGDDRPVRPQQTLAVPAHLSGRRPAARPVALRPLHRRETAMLKRDVTERRLSPAATAITTRSRRSFERGGPSDAGLPRSQHPETNNQRTGIQSDLSGRGTALDAAEALRNHRTRVCQAPHFLKFRRHCQMLRVRTFSSRVLVERLSWRKSPSR